MMNNSINLTYIISYNIQGNETNSLELFNKRTIGN